MALFFQLVSHLLHAKDDHGVTRDGSEEVIGLLEAYLPLLERLPENRDLYYILRNRQAIIRQDCFRYEEALALLDEALSASELQRESQRQLFSLLDYPIEDLPSEQQAKLLGSRTDLAEEARETARRAVEAFRFPRGTSSATP